MKVFGQRSIQFLVMLTVVTLGDAVMPAQTKSKAPSLPLPDVTKENIKIPDWRSGFPVPNSVRAWHYNPELVMPLMQLGQAVQNSTLDYQLQMMMATVVSSRNGCRYCLCSTVKALSAGTDSDSLLTALQGDLVYSRFTSKERAALVLADKLTTQPSSAADFIKQTVDAGWTNAQVAQMIFFISYMNLMNRIAEAFNLPPDSTHPYDPEGTLPMLRCE